MRYLLERFPLLLRESKFSCLCSSFFTIRVAFGAVCGGLKRCLWRELLRSSSQITGLQIGSHQETKGIVLFLEPRQRIVKVSAKRCLKQSSWWCSGCFLRGGGDVFLEAFLHVLQTSKLLRVWIHYLIAALPHSSPPLAGPSDSVW